MTGQGSSYKDIEVKDSEAIFGNPTINHIQGSQTYTHYETNNSTVVHNSPRKPRRKKPKISKELNESLLQAAHEGSPFSVKRLLGEKAKLNCKDSNGCTPLHKALLSGGALASEVVELLVIRGCAVNNVSKRLGSPLSIAALRSDQSGVDLLVKHGADVYASGAEVGSAVHAACYSGNVEIVRNIIRKPGDAILQATINLKVYEAVIDGRVHTEADGHDRIEHCTPLMLAAMQGHDVVVEHLLSINRMRIDSMEELFQGPAEREVGSLRGGKSSACVLVSQPCAILDLEDSQGMTALMFAAKHGWSKCVAKLAAMGHMNQRVKEARVCRTAPALLLAIQGFHLAEQDRTSYEECVQHLVELGACMSCEDCKDENGNDALMLAAQAGSLKTVKLILDTILPTCKLNRTQSGRRGRGKRKIYTSTRTPDSTLLRARNHLGMTALMLAAKQGFPECTKWLIHAGSDIDARADNGWSAIMFAADGQHREALDVLVAKGADLSIRSEGGETVLHRAVQTGRRDIVEAVIIASKVIEPGLVDVADNSKQTPLHIAVGQDNTECVRVLCDARADLFRLDSNKNTAMVVAMAIGSLGMVKLLTAKLPRQLRDEECKKMASKALEYPSAMSIRDYITSREFWRSRFNEPITEASRPMDLGG